MKTKEQLLGLVGRTWKIYYGKDHECRCGCAGRYARVGERLFKTYVARLKKAIEAGETHDVDTEHKESHGFVNIPVGEASNDMCYCLYF